MKKTIATALFMLPFLLVAQNSSIGDKLAALELKPVVLFQLWGSYTTGAEMYNEETGLFEAVDDRLNMQLRRSRFGLKGKLSDRVKFNITSAYDLVGHDLLTATQGGANNGASPKLRLWNAFVQWQMKKESQALNLTVGYFTPRIGRESISSPFKSGSMEKAWSQNYLRRHLVGTGPGRAAGINIGGLFASEESAVNWGYDVGVFTPTHTGLSANSSGQEASAVAVGRLALYLGDVESKKYTLGHAANHHGKRNGLTLGVAASAQGKTDMFDANYTLSADWAFNWNQLNLDGDISLLRREGAAEDAISEAYTGYARLSYNIELKDYILEPSLMFVHFQGANTIEEIKHANDLKHFAGMDQSIELTLNLHLSSNLRLSMSYTINDGDAGDATEVQTFNNYLYQGGVGAIHRGDWLGLGLIAKI